jgi:subtilisin family serine protease
VLDGSGSGTFAGIAQALVYAADQHVDVASMSLGAYVDPKADKADYELMRRAVRYARASGVLPVAATGNDDLDLGDTGPADELPAELPDVLAVSATGYLDAKAYYSNYGGTIDLAAPGGDRRFQLPPPPLAGGGRVLGAWPAADLDAVDPSLRVSDCGPSGCATYAWQQGTSMAAPQVAGVAALVVSRFGSPRLDPSKTERILLASATPHACPEPRTVTYDVPAGILASNTATCRGGTSANGFYGSGIVNAAGAVSGR